MKKKKNFLSTNVVTQTSTQHVCKQLIELDMYINDRSKPCQKVHALVFHNVQCDDVIILTMKPDWFLFLVRTLFIITFRCMRLDNVA